MREWKPKDLLNVTLNSIGDAVITTDADGLVTLLNPVAAELTGWEPNEAKGQPLQTVFRIIDGTTRSPVENPAERALREGGVVELDGETLLLSKGGTERPIEDSAAPIQDDAGRVAGVVLVFRDVTERRRAEKALQEREERFRRMADCAPVMIWTSDTDKLCNWFNKPWLDFTGRTVDQECGNGWIANIHPEDLAGCLETYVSSFDARQPFTMEYRLRRHDGEYRWVIDNGVPLHESDGQFIGYIGSAIDITDHMAAEKSATAERTQFIKHLQKNNRLKDEFLAMLGHELRNPLAAIKGGVDVLALDNIDEQTRHSVVETMASQTGHIVRLVDDLLDVSRIMRGKIELRKERVALQSVVADAVEISRPAMDARQCTVETDLPSQPLWLHADPVRLTQVFGNLLSNAAKYSSRCRIGVSGVRDDGEAVVRIRDYGIGMSPELLSRIFGLFVQGDRSLDRSEGGLGIGLTVVKTLIESHGGRVEAQSEGEGKGSEFSVFLPLAEGLK